MLPKRIPFFWLSILSMNRLMGMRPYMFALLLMALLVGCVTSHYKNGVAINPNEKIVEPVCDFEKLNYDKKAFGQFHQGLVKALDRKPASKNNRNTLEKYVMYPLVVRNSRGTKVYLTEKDVQSNLEEIFNPNIIETLKNHKIADVKCSLKGISYGEGNAWVGLDENKKFKIFSINHY